MNWYYVQDGEQVGPCAEDEFQRRVAAGVVTDGTLVWHDGLADWAAYGAVRQVAATARGASLEAMPQTGVCSDCGKLFPKQDLLAYQGVSVCAACKPAFFQRVQEGMGAPGTMTYGGFWIRVAAKIIDTIIMVGAAWLIMLIFFMSVFMQDGADPSAIMGAQLAMQGIALCIQLSYTVFFLGRFGATPGKMVCRLKVVRPNGEPITYARACGRHFADMLSGMLLYVGYIIVAFDDEKRALHDHICDTRVIKTD